MADKDIFYFPPREEIMSDYRRVVSTLISGGRYDITFKVYVTIFGTTSLLKWYKNNSAGCDSCENCSMNAFEA